MSGAVGIVNVAMRSITPAEYVVRFVRRDETWQVQLWDALHNLTEYTKETAPDWVRPIIDAAYVGGYIRASASPPPMEIVWFDVDAAHNLIRFRGGDHDVT